MPGSVGGEAGAAVFPAAEGGAATSAGGSDCRGTPCSRSEVDPSHVRSVKGITLHCHGSQTEAKDLADRGAVITQPDLIADGILRSRRRSRFTEADPADLGPRHGRPVEVAVLADAGLELPAAAAAVATDENVIGREQSRGGAPDRERDGRCAGWAARDGPPPERHGLVRAQA